MFELLDMNVSEIIKISKSFLIAKLNMKTNKKKLKRLFGARLPVYSF